MPKEYNLKLDPIVKVMVKLFLRYVDFKREQGIINGEKNEELFLRKGLSVTSYLRPIIHDKINELIAYLEKEREDNKEQFADFLKSVSKNLNKKELEQVLTLIDKKIRF